LAARSARAATWPPCELAREQGISVEGKVVSINKGGAEVELHGVKAFCPTSQLDNALRGKTPATFIGKTSRCSFKVTEVREGGRKHRAVAPRPPRGRRRSEAMRRACIDHPRRWAPW
jgi:small subunit ribosomal protein S1